ncbi:hypothetical protein NQ318_004063 [Aromia moschata]|uniref:NUP210 C-terminal Ig-like domain-containing protein n=1 Tax=Aromia moschata TaxID=1265417 RepID=A0AAV8Z849_9CUCU|nr:hypothetical protein NQ318_004063 [Aromia moschata]
MSSPYFLALDPRMEMSYADVRKLISPTGFRCFMKFSNESASIAIDKLFNITSSWVPDTGQYACKFINLGITGPEIATLTTNITLWATTEDFETESKHLEIKFLPQFYVPLEVALEENTNMGDLEVIGHPEVLAAVTVTPADSSIIFVDEGKTVNTTSTTYRIQLVDYHWRLAGLEEAMGIIVTCPKTKQEVKVIVKVTGQKQICSVPRSPLVTFFQNYKYAIAMATAMLIIFFLTFYFYSNYMHPVVNVECEHPRTMLTSSPGSPVTSVHRCSANASSQFAGMSRTSSSPTSRNNSSSCRFNCSCNGGREPIYGDASSFYTSPEIRRNRRCM